MLVEGEDLLKDGDARRVFKKIVQDCFPNGGPTMHAARRAQGLGPCG